MVAGRTLGPVLSRPDPRGRWSARRRPGHRRALGERGGARPAVRGLVRGVRDRGRRLGRLGARAQPGQADRPQRTAGLALPIPDERSIAELVLAVVLARRPVARRHGLLQPGGATEPDGSERTVAHRHRRVDGPPDPPGYELRSRVPEVVLGRQGVHGDREGGTPVRLARSVVPRPDRPAVGQGHEGGRSTRRGGERSWPGRPPGVGGGYRLVPARPLTPFGWCWSRGWAARGSIPGKV